MLAWALLWARSTRATLGGSISASEAPNLMASSSFIAVLVLPRAAPLYPHRKSRLPQRTRQVIAETMKVELFSQLFIRAPLAKSAARHAAVDHPRGSEAVDQHAEGFGPERLPDRHRYLTAFRQGSEHPLRLCDRRVDQRTRESLHLVVGLANHRAGRHQDPAVELEARVHDPIGAAGRGLGRHGGFP